jgi:hypothetical protein
MKARASDVVIWLILEGREDISQEHRNVLNPQREVVRRDDGKRLLNVSMLMDRSIFTKRRQCELVSKFKELAPYRLVAEIAIYHSTKTQIVTVEIPERILNCLGNIGAKLSIVSYLSS